MLEFNPYHRLSANEICSSKYLKSSTEIPDDLPAEKNHRPSKIWLEIDSLGYFGIEDVPEEGHPVKDEIIMEAIKKEIIF